jgi:dUTP pyrophosphatase
MTPRLGIFKENRNAFLPFLATEWSACFDLKACLFPTAIIKKRTGANVEIEDVVGHEKKIIIAFQDRVLIPTGLIFDIPEGHSVRLHPRSGLALNNGVTLANAEGVIDADYVLPVFVLLINNSNIPFVVKHGDRICQCELIKVVHMEVVEIHDAPEQKSNRSGGFGSTGI